MSEENNTIGEVFLGILDNYKAARKGHDGGMTFADFIIDDMETTIFMCSKKNGDGIKEMLETLSNPNVKVQRLLKEIYRIKNAPTKKIYSGNKRIIV